MSLLGPIVSGCFLCFLLASTSSTSVKRDPLDLPNCTTECSNGSISQNSIETSLSDGTQSAPVNTTSLNQRSPDADHLNKSNSTQLNLTNKTNDSATPFNISTTQKPLVQPSPSSPTVNVSATSVTDVPLSQTVNNELNSSTAAAVPSKTTARLANTTENTTGTPLPTTHPPSNTTLATTPTQKATSPVLSSTVKTTTHVLTTTQSHPKTKSPVVEMAGGVLTKQLVDRASLFAILLFGLLFFFVVVAVFATQAYESYKRKDYTQVDYLINGMYTDSGV